MNSKDVIHNGIPLEQVLKDILASINTQGRKASTDPRHIPFSSSRFKAKTLHEALEEAKGYVCGQLDPANFEYKKGLSIRDVLDKVVILEAVKLNDKLLELLPEDIIPEKKAVGINETFNFLLKILIRQSERTRILEEQIYELQKKVESFITNNHSNSST